MPNPKLDFEYDDASGEYHAWYTPDIRVRAVRDESPQNPFTDGDMNWPIVVRNDRRDSKFTSYDAGVEGVTMGCPFELFNDALLVHWQVHIAKAMGMSVADMVATYHMQDTDPVNYCHDGAVLRGVLQEAWEDNVSDSGKFDLAAQLLKMADVVALSTTTRGYCQGDWAEVLVVATPDAMKRFGCTEVTEADLQHAVDLYGAWAWGDVYGYIVERVVTDDDGEVIDEPVEIGSCWGYYGSDHHESGLADAALEECPAVEELLAA